MKRTAVRVPAGTAAGEAIRRATQSTTFERMPAARKRRRGAATNPVEDRAEEPTDTDTDLEESMTELFEQDSQPDLVADEDDLDDELANAKTEAEDVAAAYRADGVRVSVHRNGAVWRIDSKGHLKELLHAPARDEETGQFVQGREGSPGSPEWFQATTREEVVDRVKERIENLGASLFQKSGGLSPVRRQAMTRAFIADRDRRVADGDTRFKLGAGTAKALREWAESGEA